MVAVARLVPASARGATPIARPGAAAAGMGAIASLPEVAAMLGLVLGVLGSHAELRW
jgi:hypothetical protein